MNGKGRTWVLSTVKNGGPKRTILSVSQKSNSLEIRGSSVWLYHTILTKLPLINLTPNPPKDVLGDSP